MLNFYLSNPEHPDTFLRFSTLTGKLVKQVYWGKEFQSLTVPVSELKSGIYLYDLMIDQAKLVGRFMKE